MTPEFRELKKAVDDLRSEVHTVKQSLENNHVQISTQVSEHGARIESLEHSRRAVEMQMQQIQKVVMGLQVDVQQMQRTLSASSAEQSAKLDRILEVLKG